MVMITIEMKKTQFGNGWQNRRHLGQKGEFLAKAWLRSVRIKGLLYINVSALYFNERLQILKLTALFCHIFCREKW